MKYNFSIRHSEIFDSPFLLSFKNKKLEKAYSSKKIPTINLVTFNLLMFLISLAPSVISHISEDKHSKGKKEHFLLHYGVFYALDGCILLNIFIICLNNASNALISRITTTISVFYLRSKTILVFSQLAFLDNNYSFIGYLSLLSDYTGSILFISAFPRLYYEFAINYISAGMVNLLVIRVVGLSQISNALNLMLFFYSCAFIATMYLLAYSERENAFFRLFIDEVHSNFIELLNTVGVSKITLDKKGKMLSYSEPVKKFAEELALSEPIQPEDANESSSEFILNDALTVEEKIRGTFMTNIAVEGQIVDGYTSSESIFKDLFKVKNIKNGPFSFLIKDLFGCVSSMEKKMREFALIGTKILKTSRSWTKFEVYGKINKLEKTVDFLFKDISLESALEEAKKQKEEIPLKFAKILHEIKNPLLIITNLSKNIKSDLEDSSVVDDKTLSNVNLIKELSKYSSILVKDFDVMTSHSGLEINEEEVNLKRCIYFCTDIFEALRDYKDKRIKIISELASSCPEFFKGDELKIKQIIINLLSNAFKFTNSGYISVKAFFEEESKVLKIAVVDSGNGISDEKKKKLFVPYEASSKKNNEYGTGLGLSVVKELVEAMKGEIRVRDNPEELGTMFEFCIPVRIIHKSKKVLISEAGDEDNKINAQDASPVKEDGKGNLMLRTCLSMTKEPNAPIIAVSPAITVRDDIHFFDEGKLPYIMFADDDYCTINSLRRMSNAFFEKNEKKIDCVFCKDGVEVLSRLFSSRGKELNCLAVVTDDEMEFIGGKQLIALLEDLFHFSKIRRFDLYSCTSNNMIKASEGVVAAFNKPITYEKFSALLETYNK